MVCREVSQVPVVHNCIVVNHPPLMLTEDIAQHTDTLTQVSIIVRDTCLSNPWDDKRYLAVSCKSLPMPDAGQSNVIVSFLVHLDLAYQEW